MNWLSKTPTDTGMTPVESQTLEQMFAGLEKVGRPSTMQHSDGRWSCRVDMTIPVVGGSFQVSSDFTHPSLSAAVQVCLTRAQAAVIAMNRGSDHG